MPIHTRAIKKNQKPLFFDKREKDKVNRMIRAPRKKRIGSWIRKLKALTRDLLENNSMRKLIKSETTENSTRYFASSVFASKSHASFPVSNFYISISLYRKNARIFSGIKVNLLQNNSISAIIYGKVLRKEGN